MNESPLNHDQNLEKADRLAYLIFGHVRNTLTPQERDELDDWITESDENLELFEKLTDEDNIEMGIQDYLQKEKLKEQSLIGVQDRIKNEKKYSVWPWVVAVSLLLAVASFYLFRQPKNNHVENTTVENTNSKDIAPGQNKAVLTLSNGRTIILDSSKATSLAKEEEVNISQNNGQLLYSGKNIELKMNEISTPRGGQYNVILTDGTKVWLNAESSLKFPASFTDNIREVEVSGEAYFEVAKDVAKPFIVSINARTGKNQKVTVLGTHFNINAYEDESSTYVTLLEGSVKLDNGSTSKILTPGEQAVSTTGIEIRRGDVNEAVAWKEGKFLFHDATIQSIGEQIKRWYDIDVQYEQKGQKLFNTEVSRNVPLSKLLNGLEGTGQIEFKFENKKLIIK